MDYKQILQTYFELLFYGVFGLSTLFLIATYIASYKWPKLIAALSYLGVSSIPLLFGAISRYFFEQYRSSNPVEYNNPQVLALCVYFFVNGSLALHFWAKRVREHRLERTQHMHANQSKNEKAA